MSVFNNFNILREIFIDFDLKFRLSQATDASQAQGGETIVRTGSPALTPSGPSSGGGGLASPPKSSYAVTAGAPLDSPGK